MEIKVIMAIDYGIRNTGFAIFRSYPDPHISTFGSVSKKIKPANDASMAIMLTHIMMGIKNTKPHVVVMEQMSFPSKSCAFLVPTIKLQDRIAMYCKEQKIKVILRSPSNTKLHSRGLRGTYKAGFFQKAGLLRTRTQTLPFAYNNKHVGDALALLFSVIQKDYQLNFTIDQ